ncbi:hypothetical protein BPNPMPFG_007418 (plasmid) [Mesorhizobium sp. AR07]|uniref:hypothetical protein n=1 Tax=Mesorhizobium sp. AR07 TaxID=2865838 RepID=UPI00215F384F|nr:hypothetical protein [Mesorhizobium sp. AR07]UVK48882.1 hypothetical protein BPNPMPFG_007418 [Mesorhizobium sp. AR07]
MSIFEAADYAVASLRRADFGRAQASMRLAMLFWQREARDACPKPDIVRKHVRFKHILGTVEVFHA